MTADLTIGDVLALPAVVSLWPDAAKALGVSRTHAYDSVADGTWPTSVLRVGRAIRIPTAELRAVLGIDDSAALRRVS
jgi:predicted DNA-binding transcriptional regulator AlpA